MKSTSRVTWQSVFTAVMYGFMYFPIIVLAVYSFNASRFSANWEGFSLKWYRSLFSDTRIFLALKDSLTIAFVAVGVSAVFR